MGTTIAYIDGFNLYYGICAAGLRRYLWLDLARLAEWLADPGDCLVTTHYFTAMVKHDPADSSKQKRQESYVNAIRATGSVQIRLGRYAPVLRRCPHGHVYTSYVEKFSDVRLACQMLEDARTGACDAFLLVSGDGDLAEPVRIIGRQYPGKRITVAFPPKRTSKEFHRLQSAIPLKLRHISHTELKACQLPPSVSGTGGKKYLRPAAWT